MIILIGGSGFIGAYLAEKLIISKINFTIIDKKINPKFTHLTKLVDILDKKSLIDNIPFGSTIINLAAIHKDDEKRKDYYSVNVQGAKNICEVSKLKKCKKIIFFSSVAVYGKAPPFADESAILKPCNFYGKSKMEAERIYVNWNNEYSANQLIIIRPTAVFGKGNKGNIHNLISQINKGLFFMIGSGKNIKSLAYVENLVGFTFYLLESKKKYGLYNYIDKPQISLIELINFCRLQLNIKSQLKHIPYSIAFLVGIFFDILSKILNRKFKISKVRVEKFVIESSYVANLDGYTAEYSLIDALKKTIIEEFKK